MAEKFTNADYCRAAKALGCTPIDIKTVSGVEAPKGAFTPDGFPTILYERHVFWAKAPRNKRQQWYKDHPDLCNPNTTPKGGYGTPAAQRKKLERAILLDESTALKACSWGAFQELGMNYADVGFATVQDFVKAMKSSASAQLDIFVKSIQHRGLQRALREHKWDNFAFNYNGAGYRKWGYVPALEAAYKKASKSPIDCSKYSAASSQPQAQTADSISPESETADATVPPTIQNAEQIINTGDSTPPAPAPVDVTLNAPQGMGSVQTATKVTVLGITVPPFLLVVIETIKGWISDGFLDAKEIGNTVVSLIKDNSKYILIAVGLVVVVIIIKKITRELIFLVTVITHAIPGWNSVTVIAPEKIVPEKKWWKFWAIGG